MDVKAIKAVLDSGSGLALREYLLMRLNELKSIDNVKEKDTPSHQAIEVKAQKRSYNKLREILEEVMNLSEEERKKDPKDSFEVGVDN